MDRFSHGRKGDVRTSPVVERGSLEEILEDVDTESSRGVGGSGQRGEGGVRSAVRASREGSHVEDTTRSHLDTNELRFSISS